MGGSHQVTNQVWNVPNVLSMIRLAMAVAVVILIPLEQLRIAFVLFVIAAATDWIDGWWARKFNQVTQLGRILDPFCDKMIVCGSYICLAVEMREFPWYAAITGWMAVIVMGREMLVTALRSFIEQAGGDFSAKYVAKVKMLLQCIAIGASFVALMYVRADAATRADHASMIGTSISPLVGVPFWIQTMLIGSIWGALATTLYSGGEYVVAAAAFLKQNSAFGAASDDEASEAEEGDRKEIVVTGEGPFVPPVG